MRARRRRQWAPPPLLALNAGGYFPGLTTSLLMAAIGVPLLARLARVAA